MLSLTAHDMMLCDDNDGAMVSNVTSYLTGPAILYYYVVMVYVVPCFSLLYLTTPEGDP